MLTTNDKLDILVRCGDPSIRRGEGRVVLMEWTSNTTGYVITVQCDMAEVLLGSSKTKAADHLEQSLVDRAFDIICEEELYRRCCL